MHDDFTTIAWTPQGTIRLIDQTRLPLEEVYLECGTVDEVAHAIRTLQVRGAPAIGIAAAMGLALGARTIREMQRVEIVYAPSTVTEGKSWQLAGLRA